MHRPRILYLHGLGSSGQARTAQGLQAAGLTVSAPDYAPQHYRQSLEQLQPLLKAQPVDLLVGTSMGGYYALKLAEGSGLPVVAVNACFEPAVLLQPLLAAPAWDFANDCPIPFTQAMLDAFTTLAPDRLAEPVIIIGDHDEVIPAAYQHDYCRRVGWRWISRPWGHRVEEPDWLAQQLLATWRGQPAPVTPTR